MRMLGELGEWPQSGGLRLIMGSSKPQQHGGVFGTSAVGGLSTSVKTKICGFVLPLAAKLNAYCVRPAQSAHIWAVPPALGSECCAAPITRLSCIQATGTSCMYVLLIVVCCYALHRC